MSAQTKTKFGDWGIDFTGFDKNTRPQDNFDRFCNGAWQDSTLIPKKESRWGMFMILREESKKALHAILENIVSDKDIKEGSDRWKLKTIYQSGMNAGKLNRDGAKPLGELFDKIDAIQNRKELVAVIAQLHLYDIRVFWGIDVHQDVNDTRKMILSLDQSGISLPERGYYFDKDKKEKKDKFAKHIRAMFELLGYSQKKATEAARTVMVIETFLAKASWSNVELRNIPAQVNYMRTAGLQILASSLDWDLYFDALGVEELEAFMVGQLDFMPKVGSLIGGTNLDGLKIYMKWWVLNEKAHLLSDDFVEQDFEFWNKTMQGQEKLQPRWERCVEVMDDSLGQMLGEEYVKRYFSPESKAGVEKLVENILGVMENRIQNLDWMSAATKGKAITKLRSFETLMAYPDKWIDYSDLVASKDSFVQNILRAQEFSVRRNIQKIGQPTDRSSWPYGPQTVNAMSRFLSNQILFPAGILQPPFFDLNADDAVNYSAIGAVIGHEIIHAFDDMGAQFDKNGNLKNWWSKKDKAEFSRRCEVVVKQFNEFEVLPDLFVNGSLTQGENIGDLGGLSIAYEAYINSEAYRKAPRKLDGFTREQRFFLGFGQIWRAKARKEFIKQMVATNPHAPEEFRIRGTLLNTPEFFEAFGVQEGDGMWRPPQERAEIW